MILSKITSSDLELSPEVLQEFNEYVYGRLEVMGWLVLWSVGMTSPNIYILPVLFSTRYNVRIHDIKIYARY